MNSSNLYSINIGYQSGTTKAGDNAISIGYQAGQTQQRSGAIAMGYQAGQNTQGTNSVAIGVIAGQNTQGNRAIAIGSGAGNLNQLSGTIAMGVSAGQNTQGTNSVAIGASAGVDSQKSNAVAIGTSAGFQTQGEYSIAIGANAGPASQNANTIVLNASGVALNTITSSATYVAPIRNGLNAQTSGSNSFSSLQGYNNIYNNQTKEVVFSNPLRTYCMNFGLGSQSGTNTYIDLYMNPNTANFIAQITVALITPDANQTNAANAVFIVSSNNFGGTGSPQTNVANIYSQASTAQISAISCGMFGGTQQRIRLSWTNMASNSRIFAWIWLQIFSFQNITLSSVTYDAQPGGFTLPAIG